MLEKMGWKKGKGLGANEDGVQSHIGIDHRSGNEGLGWKEKDNSGDLLTDYEKVLAQLNAQHGGGSQSSQTSSCQDDGQHRTNKKPLKVRHRYSKIRRAKDVSSYSKEDMAKILAVKLEDLPIEGLKQEDCVGYPSGLFPIMSFQGAPVKQEEEDEIREPQMVIKQENEATVEIKQEKEHTKQRVNKKNKKRKLSETVQENPVPDVAVIQSSNDEKERKYSKRSKTCQ